jgi:hypothetical protein
MSAIDTEYEADDPLPPGAIGEVAQVSHDIQARFRYGHDADGIHNDPLIPHCWGVFSESAGAYTLEDSAGLSSWTDQGTGWIQIVTTEAMLSTYTWQVVVWPIFKAGGTGEFPLYGYEARNTGGGEYDKGSVNQTTVELIIVNEDGTRKDDGFSFAVYGLRSL